MWLCNYDDCVCTVYIPGWFMGMLELKGDEGLTSSLWYSLVNKKKRSVEQKNTSDTIKMHRTVLMKGQRC